MSEDQAPYGKECNREWEDFNSERIRKGFLIVEVILLILICVGLVSLSTMSGCSKSKHGWRNIERNLNVGDRS